MVDAAEGLLGLPHHFRHLIRIANIHRYGQHLSLKGLHFPLRPVQLFLIPADNHHMGALLAQPGGDPLADPAGGGAAVTLFAPGS